MYDLYIANKNYSSWSLRPWVLLREFGIPFTEHLIPFGDAASWERYRKIAPNGKVPCLVDGATVVWDSLSIVEYLAERHAGMWPMPPQARAWARSAAAEMHSGFSEIRNRCSMSCGVKVRLHEFPEPLEREVARLGALWNQGLERFGGPYLAGAEFCAVDAFFAPMAFRIRTYGLSLDAPAGEYAARLLDRASLRTWDAAALQETLRDDGHEAEIRQLGTVLEDRRSV